jgi:hypothetical protein
MNPENQPYPPQPGPQPGQPPQHNLPPVNQPQQPPGSMSPQQQQDYSQPVAYDNQGRPLYAHPPAGYAPPQPQPQFVHLSRAVSPEHQPIPPEIVQRYEASRKKYPHLNLSKGEYVINAVKRHPIGVIQIWVVVAVLIILFGVTYAMLFLGQSFSDLIANGISEEQTGGGLAVLALSALFVLGGLVATYLYNNNRFYLTNESVIQEIQTTLFSKHEQTVSLSNIEDASYRQDGILAMMFNYGTIRLSTEGDETTYRFSYVTRPKQHIAILNNAVEAFKNGRPVEDLHDDQSS